MDEIVKIVPLFDPELHEFLANNNVDLCDLLKDQGYKVEGETGSDPTTTGTKDAVSIILATAALSAVLQPALKKIIEGLTNRAVRVTELVPVEVPSASSEVGQQSGEPKFIWTERTKLLEPTKDRENVKLSTSFLGFKFEYESAPVE
jgi:hypothetical protein